MQKILICIFFIFLFTPGLAGGHGEHSLRGSEETNPQAFKALKEKSLDPQTQVPRTLDPNLFKGKVKRAYEIAREIPEGVAQIPCFCGCEAYGHENLLDCFIDFHGAG